MLFFNITASVVLAILVSWFGLFALCQYSIIAFCYQDYIYSIVGGATACGVLLLFFIQQYANTQQLLQPKQRKALPHFANRRSIFERSVLWNIWNVDDKLTKTVLLEDLEDYGWVIEYDKGYPLIVSQAAYYHWLLNVAKTQQQLETSGQWRTVSPLGARQNPDVSRKRLDAYINMLEAVDAVEYVNGNVRRLKSSCAADVWTKVMKKLEIVQPLVKI